MPTLNWLGKDAVINHHNDVKFKVLDKKYDFNTDSTSENKIIHGDNLEALKALLPEYEGKIKCIYIDPPYNTGNEGWVYNDNVNSDRIKKWLGQVVGKESEDFSRHDKWLCMMYPRLKLLHKLLSNDGAIFISIDDNEQANLKLLCDEIWGHNNFIAQVIWERAYAPVNLKKHFSTSHDYIICYAKSVDLLLCNGLPRKDSTNNKYKNPDNDPRGLWRTDNLAVGPIVESQVYEITTPSGRKVWPPKGYCWRLTKDRFVEYVNDNRIWFGENGDLVPAPKRFLSEVKDSMTPMTIWKYSEVGHSQDAMRKLRDIFDGEVVFDYPKSVDLVKRCFELYTDKSSIILDSFAGSGTTAHAVLNLNKQDGGNRKFILVEMEDYAETITAERVKRVINGYGDTPGTGGDFSYYELGQELFVSENELNEDIDEETIRKYVWYSETHTPYRRTDADSKYFMGDYNDTDYYFYYEKDLQTSLSLDTLNILIRKAQSYIVYADVCNLPLDFMRSHNITFRKIPRNIRKF